MADPTQYAGNATDEANRLASTANNMAERQAARQKWMENDRLAKQAQGARDSQNDAMGLAQAAAYGNAPSAAQSLGQNMLDQSLQAQMAGAASARGGALAQAAAARGAAQQSGVMQMQGANQLAAMRAQEMAQARGDYSQMAGQMRGQDFQAQGLAQQKVASQTQNEQFQRSLNQQAQMGYEGMSQGVYGSQLGANMATKQMESQERQAELQRQWQSRENDLSFMRDLGGKAIGGALGGIGFLSDARAKVPLASADMAFAAPGGAVSPAKDAGPGLGSLVLRGAGSAISGQPMMGGGGPKSLGEAAMAGFANAKPAPQAPQMATPVISVRPLDLPKAPVFDVPQAPQLAVSDMTAKVPMGYSDMRAKKPVSDAEAARLVAAADKAFAGTAADPKGMGSLASALSQMQALGKTAPAIDGSQGRAQMADAARAMQASPYAYKPGMEPPEQEPGEPNVGPMAQTMAQNPVTATAVRKDPRSGLLMIDQGKMTKVLGGVVADQQQQIDGLAAMVAQRGR
jgi:hypothetical protein